MSKLFKSLQPIYSYWSAKVERGEKQQKVIAIPVKTIRKLKKLKAMREYYKYKMENI